MSAQDTEPISGELVVTEQQQRTLFRTDDPVEVLDRARHVADALKEALQAGGMVQHIGSNDHVRIDGWQTLGAMLGISAHVVWSRPLQDRNGWEARAEAITADGRTVGAAEAMCTRNERNWRSSDEYAVRSMAQTRAMSKALRGPLGFVITLAGHNATPAEEAADTTAEPYGPAASRAEQDSLLRALETLGSSAAAGSSMIKDAGGYLPRISARAVMYVAANRHQEVPEAAATEPDSMPDTPDSIEHVEDMDSQPGSPRSEPD